MPPLVIPDTFLVSCSGTTLGQPWFNIYGVHVDAVTLWDQEAATAFGNLFRTFYDTIKASLSTTWVLTDIIIYDLRSGTALSYDASLTSVTGTNNGHALSPAIAACATHKTGLRGRRYQGRTYLAGWTENDNDTTGTFSSATRTAVQNAYTALREDIVDFPALTAQLAVVSRVGKFSTPITSTTIDPEWDHQDRRKRG